MEVMVKLFAIIVENHVETYTEQILSSCQQIKTQIANLQQAYQSYHASNQRPSQC